MKLKGTINGLVSLPDPLKLIDGWFTASYNLPNTIFEQVNTYMKETDAGRAFKWGKSLLVLGHIDHLMNHLISPNICYLHIRKRCVPPWTKKRKKSLYCLGLPA